MTDSNGTSIVCALRGGPGSHYTRRAALERAVATGAHLYLVVTVPPNAYEPLHEGEQRAIRAELAWRELALARANAAEIGNPEAQFSIRIRIGELATTVGEFIEEVGASLLVLGAPRLAADAALTESDMAELVESVRTGTGVEVEVVHPPA